MSQILRRCNCASALSKAPAWLFGLHGAGDPPRLAIALRLAPRPVARAPGGPFLDFFTFLGGEPAGSGASAPGPTRPRAPRAGPAAPWRGARAARRRRPPRPVRPRPG